MDFTRQFLLVGAGCILSFAPAASDDVRFEVASVRRSAARAADSVSLKTGDRRGSPGEFEIDRARFTATNVNLYGLIIKAFGLTACRAFAGPCALVSGGPVWLAKDGFNIRAKAPDGSPDYSLAQFLTARAPRLQCMLQALLEDRFRLKVHSEKRQIPVYLLATGSREPKLGKADPAEESRMGFRPIVQPNGDNTIELFSKNGSMEQLTRLLSVFMDRPVLNRTGLQGGFDFAIDYDSNSDAPGAFSGATGPGMFRAFQAQLGLKLEAAKGLVDVLVIDRAERPVASEN